MPIPGLSLMGRHGLVLLLFSYCYLLVCVFVLLLESRTLSPLSFGYFIAISTASISFVFSLVTRERKITAVRKELLQGIAVTLKPGDGLSKLSADDPYGKRD